jgi:uncharacterized membrane protein
MNDTMNSKKMWSGRYLLCVCAAFSLMAFSGVVAYLMVVNQSENVQTIAMTMISNVLIAVITFYFTKSRPTE